MGKCSLSASGGARYFSRLSLDLDSLFDTLAVRVFEIDNSSPKEPVLYCSVTF